MINKFFFAQFYFIIIFNQNSGISLFLYSFFCFFQRFCSKPKRKLSPAPFPHHVWGNSVSCWENLFLQNTFLHFSVKPNNLRERDMKEREWVRKRVWRKSSSSSSSDIIKLTSENWRMENVRGKLLIHLLREEKFSHSVFIFESCPERWISSEQ